MLEKGAVVTIGGGTLTWKVERYVRESDRYVLASENTGRRRVVAAGSVYRFLGRTIPDDLCGAGGCVFLPGHEPAEHSWEPKPQDYSTGGVMCAKCGGAIMFTALGSRSGKSRWIHLGSPDRTLDQRHRAVPKSDDHG